MTSIFSQIFIYFLGLSRAEVLNYRDKGAQKYSISDDALLDIFSLTYKDVCSYCKKQIIGFKINSKFNEIMKKVKTNSNYAYGRRLNPKNSSSGTQYFYSKEVIKYIEEEYNHNNIKEGLCHK